MKSFALFYFLLLAPACIFVARADEEILAVDDASELGNPPDIAAEKEQADKKDTEADEEETKDDEEYTKDDEETEDDETEEDEGIQI
ncbi:ribosomal L1 domain-containing protein CG13096-like [Dendronephthya gigantea]|uniref:ribosomal L1 domain-containing protein CG13096-like n=1 Tax=Dendronephthya gigantea TaxID=151771 RepID=UPI00106BA813|nr:ribosomal L1 domain-containing protein CG13096-like [Dendronephthya gigantea]